MNERDRGIEQAKEQFLLAHPDCERCGQPATDIAIVPASMPVKGDRGVRPAALCRRHAEQERRANP